jgi:glutathione peroxidase
LEAYDINDELVKFKEFKDKKLILIVNVASQCGLTKKNYTSLNILYDTFEDQGKISFYLGLEILAFPCNGFMNQEPGCSTVFILYNATYEKTNILI